MTGDELKRWQTSDAERRAQVEPMTLAGILAWLAVGVMVAVIIVGALWLTWAG